MDDLGQVFTERQRALDVFGAQVADLFRNREERPIVYRSVVLGRETETVPIFDDFVRSSIEDGKEIFLELKVRHVIFRGAGGKQWRVNLILSSTPQRLEKGSLTVTDLRTEPNDEFSAFSSFLIGQVGCVSGPSVGETAYVAFCTPYKLLARTSYHIHYRQVGEVGCYPIVGAVVKRLS